MRYLLERILERRRELVVWMLFSSPRKPKKLNPHIPGWRALSVTISKIIREPVQQHISPNVGYWVRRFFVTKWFDFEKGQRLTDISGISLINASCERAPMRCRDKTWVRRSNSNLGHSLEAVLLVFMIDVEFSSSCTFDCVILSPVLQYYTRNACYLSLILADIDRSLQVPRPSVWPLFFNYRS